MNTERRKNVANILRSKIRWLLLIWAVIALSQVPGNLVRNISNLMLHSPIMHAGDGGQFYWQTSLTDNRVSGAGTNADQDAQLTLTAVWIQRYGDRYLLGHFALLRQRPTVAHRYFAESPNTFAFPLIAFFSGASLMAAGEPERALGVWQQDPRTAELLLRIGGDTLYRENDPEGARPYFSLANAINPSACEPIYRLGVSWDQEGRQDKALDALGNGLLSCSDRQFAPAVYYLRGRILASFNRLNAAILEASRAARLEPKNPTYLIFFANLLVRSGQNHDEAGELFREAMALEPSLLEPYVGLCNLERSQRNYEKALDWCQLATDGFPEAAISYFRTGQVYLAAKEFEEAISWFRLAVSHESTNENMWIRLGEAYEGHGNYSEAVAAYRRALELDPDNAYAQRKVDELANQR